MKLIQDMVRKLSDERNEWLDLEFRKIVKEFATPPIKGTLTGGKCKWRGIRMFRDNNLRSTVYTVRQRGKQIGPKLQIKYPDL